MKIAFIGGRGVIGTYSGIETYYEEVGSRLAAMGHEVTAYCRSYFTPAVRTHRGIRIRRLPAVRTKHLETVTHSAFSTLDALFRRFDLIQFHAIGNSPFALMRRLVGTRTVLSVRGLDWQRAKWGRFARWMLQMGERASVHCPTATTVVSRTLERHYGERHAASPVFIPNAIVATPAQGSERIRALGVEPDRYFLFSGRISPEKGVHTLVEAFASMDPDFTLVLAGGSSYSGEYIDRVRSMAGANVRFVGRVDRETMAELLTHCYAFVLPSAMEGLSIALLEAVSHGCCIVTTEIPENLEVVGDAARTFPWGDVAALQEILRDLVERPAEVAELRARTAALARVMPDWDEIARRTESFYLDLLSRDEVRFTHRGSDRETRARETRWH